MNMALSEIEKHLKTLRLHGMNSTLSTRITQANQGDCFVEVFACLVADELDSRHSRLIETRFKASGLKERPTLTEFDWGLASSSKRLKRVSGASEQAEFQRNSTHSVRTTNRDLQIPIRQ